eukprot:scaffold82646_cov47-Phaeocystis_antarctica.AAC.2
MAPHVPPKTLPASVAFAADTSLRNLARSPEARSPEVRSPDAKSPMSSPLPPSLPLPASVVEALEPPPSASASAMATSSTSRGLTPSMPGMLRVLCEALRREAQPHLVSIAVVSRAAVSRATHISVAAPASAPESLLLRRASCSLPAAAQACPRSAPQIGAQMGGRLAWRAARRAAWQRVRQGAEEAVRPLRPLLRTRTSAQMIPAPDMNQRASSYCERAV